MRFHGARKIDRDVVAAFVDPDWAKTGALVAVSHR
jgi:hypothetical protein